jgi:cobyrinic acid a,c-diamide synthase
MSGSDPAAAQVYEVHDRCGKTNASGGYKKGNCLGSYVHLHFGSNPDMAAHFAGACGA